YLPAIPKGFSCGQFPSIWRPSVSVHKKDIESTDGGFKQLNGALRDGHWSVCLSKNRGVSEKTDTHRSQWQPTGANDYNLCKQRAIPQIVFMEQLCIIIC
ncbi:MAG: hypothetical protein ACI4TK_12720, partial [Agathobacter sp.]